MTRPIDNSDTCNAVAGHLLQVMRAVHIAQAALVRGSERDTLDALQQAGAWVRQARRLLGVADLERDHRRMHGAEED
jgi:hypothetical protein